MNCKIDGPPHRKHTYINAELFRPFSLETAGLFESLKGIFDILLFVALPKGSEAGNRGCPNVNGY